jgi:hypothetical protein
MQIARVIFVCALVLASATMAGQADGDLPGAGTFHYSGSQMTASASLAVAVR